MKEMNERKTEIQLGPSYDNVHSYKGLIHWCLEYLSYTFNNTDVDALKAIVHKSIYSSLQKGYFTVHHSSQMSSARVYIVFLSDFGFPVTVEMSDWQLIPSWEQHPPCTFMLAGPRDRWQVSFPLTVPSGWYKWTVLITYSILIGMKNRIFKFTQSGWINNKLWQLPSTVKA